MISFLVCGLILLFYAYQRFAKTRILYPSVIFSVMWGFNFLFTVLILNGAIDNLYLEKYYDYKYIDKYIWYFTAVSIGAFTLAHLIYKRNKINALFSLDGLGVILNRYRWVIWINFIGGILRIVLLINTFGFGSVMEYRLAAEQVMYYGEGIIGWVFRITNYIVLLANFYVAADGLRAGMTKLELKPTIILFLLYAPTQLATGGRLFILYFILFFFGAFILGRRMKMKSTQSKFLLRSERRALIISLCGLIILIPAIALARYDDNSDEGNESAFAKFSYITEGTLATEVYIQHAEHNNLPEDNGATLLGIKSDTNRSFWAHLRTTRMGSTVLCILTPLYMGFGETGSLIVWFILAFLCELFSVICLNRLTIIKFFIFMTLLKFMYESVMVGSLSLYYPVIELIIILILFKKYIFQGIRNTPSINARSAGR